MSDMRIKRLQVNEHDFSTVITDVVKKFTDRVAASNERLKGARLDAPYFPGAVSLGPENLKDSPVYKVNVPGYFYRQHYKGDWTSTGVAGVLIADSPSRVGKADSRMVYMAGSDGGIGHANNIFPILPGSSTYAYIVRDVELSDKDVTREWLFVPTVLGASLNIHPDSYMSKVGNPGEDYDLSGMGNPITTKTAWMGEWKDGFKSVCGWNVADEDKMNFIDTASREEFISERKEWILGLGANLETQGY